MKIGIINYNEIPEELKASIEALVQRGAPKYIAQVNKLFGDFYKLERVDVDDHQNPHPVYMEEGETLPLDGPVVVTVLGHSIYAVIVIDNQLALSLLDKDDIISLDNIAVEGDLRLYQNVNLVNQNVFDKLYKELNSASFMGAYSIVESVSLVKDVIKISVNLKNDSNRTITDNFKILVTQNFAFDTIRNVKIDLEMNKNGVMDLYGIYGNLHDIVLLSNVVRDIYNYVVTMELKEFGIEKDTDMYKLGGEATVNVDTLIAVPTEDIENTQDETKQGE